MAVARKIVESRPQPNYNRIVLQPTGGRSQALVLTSNNTLITNQLIKDETIASMNQRLDARLKESYAP